MFKTLKYVANFQSQGFVTLTEARLWVKRFVEWYNNEHRHSGINYVTPSQRYVGLDQELLRKRKEVYEKAKERHPERWAKDDYTYLIFKILTYLYGCFKRKYSFDKNAFNKAVIKMDDVAEEYK